MESRTNYASDLTNRQWQVIRQLLPNAIVEAESRFVDVV